MDWQINELQLTEELSALSFKGMLTDPGYLKLELVSTQRNEVVRALVDEWRNAGPMQLRCDRRSSNGEMIAPGYYKLRHLLRSTYEKPEVTAESSSFYLPLYYYEDCGAAPSHDAHLVRGTRTTIHDETIVQDDQEVGYRFTGLNPAVAYEVKANYLAGEDNVEQALYAEQNLIHAPVIVGQIATKTEWLAIPAQAVADRGLELRFVKTGGAGSASVAEIWLREANYDPSNPPVLEEVSQSVPTQFALKQNYPNPFNPTTTIEFSIPENHRGAVSLRIYNMLGEVVRELVAGELAPGNYRQVWDGLDNFGQRMASGLYVYQLRAGSFSISRKLLLMK
jgi:hypothetical protein